MFVENGSIIFTRKITIGFFRRKCTGVDRFLDISRELTNTIRSECLMTNLGIKTFLLKEIFAETG